MNDLCLQAERLFQICDTDDKGFIVRADLPKLDGLIANVTFSHLEEFFNANDTTRTSIVGKQDFIRGIKPLLINSRRDITHEDLIRPRKCLQELPMENFRTISLESEPFQKKFSSVPTRSKLSIAISTPTDHQSTSRGLAKSSITPSVSSSNFAPYVHIQESKRPQSAVDYNDETPEGRNHMEFSEMLRHSSNSNPDLVGRTTLADELRSPDRIYKVVFVGDSAVGKTCFLHRFCHNRFKALFNATIGVDFTVKNVKVNERVVAIQLWDTAGQERFRSITKQYFRKADAVVLLYDITSEQSFLNIRNWISSVQNGVDEECAMILVGNKIDLCPTEESRAVGYKDAKAIANEFNMVYFETSAYTGLGINECMRAVALKLLQRDEENLEESLRLEIEEDAPRSSWCCV
ncbi:unnamed protein product [Bursaphelenchus okinawaensis]|uniref:EF-hand domain-containing protein n=1 Tax=Bursaphelenchus okinawaensis TaxID=465554 RepID=A0A811L1B0_9BILA|nr:unnamed protein product [Bursaphelenchus okinawaensis]CAG9114703.1 unnamed protein product [Bursaphelenchus okinawaensis]